MKLNQILKNISIVWGELPVENLLVYNPNNICLQCGFDARSAEICPACGHTEIEQLKSTFTIEVHKECTADNDYIDRCSKNCYDCGYSVQEITEWIPPVKYSGALQVILEEFTKFQMAVDKQIRKEL